MAIIIASFTQSRASANPAPSNWPRSRGIGGCNFAGDPETPADQQSLFWQPGLRPQAIELSPVDHRDGSTEPIVRLAHLAGLDLRRAPDGWHGIWQVDGVTHQFWLSRAPPDAACFYATSQIMDDFYELRSHAARRFWRSIKGRSPGPDFRAMPAQLREFHILSLRALDARLRGESYRTVAEVLLGFHGSKEDWEVDPRKNKARRLVANGIKMMKGGYRLLLHYPIRPGS
ncbi:DUF2285 domain-containing protein [Shinella zoogloeoides]|uniref:DUF2285 domain-containing protein n=1 Tax=Shinella zoogloeoides TaxID=352475 RepID=A0A6N8TII0_SHIZO|nr:DUF2285 domain-containing protein [Shinella zoogloeoides]